MRELRESPPKKKLVQILAIFTQYKNVRTSIYFKRFIIQAFSDVGFVRETMCLFFLAIAENIATAVLKHIAVFNFASQCPFRKIRPDTEYMSYMALSTRFVALFRFFAFIETIMYVLRGLKRQSNYKNTLRKIGLTLKQIAFSAASKLFTI